MEKFDDPRQMVPATVLNYLSTVRVPAGLRLPEDLRRKWPGFLKSRPEDFVVLEPVPAYPGITPPYANALRLLTIGANSDMPGLRTDRELTVTFRGRTRPAVALTMVKKGETTWRVIDLLSHKLSTALGRRIHHEQILTSGLKDRTAVTAQTVVVVGVTFAEMQKVDWSDCVPGRYGYFVKDIRPTDRLIDQGDHQVNGFRIRVLLPGKQRHEIAAYLNARAQVLDYLGYMLPNAFDLQRLGPTQDNQKWGRTLLTGAFQPPEGCNPFITNAEAMLFQMLFAEPVSGGEELRRLRRELKPYWQHSFPRLEQKLRPHYKRLKMTLEYEVARRLADDNYRGLAEAVLYDLRDRLSIAIGAWQAVYWNWALASLIERGAADRRTTIPLAFSCEGARQFYAQHEFGSQCLAELAVTEQLAASAEPYLHAFLKDYWSTGNANADGRNNPDKTLLSAPAVLALFCGPSSLAGIPRPSRRALSAAFVRHMLLVPRDLRTGLPKEAAPARRALMRVNEFNFQVEDGAAELQFNLRSGSYASMVIGLLFDLTAPENNATTPGDD